MAEFVCGVREKNPDYLSTCKDLPEYRETGYCVLHFPGEKKKEDFEQVKKDKLEQEVCDFRGTVFPEGTSDFEVVEFDDNASFEEATFVGGANFKEALFHGGADFTGAKFYGSSALSNGIRERTTDFRRAIFRRELYFREAEFKGFTDFYRTNFLDAVKFIGGGFVGEEGDFKERTNLRRGTVRYIEEGGEKGSSSAFSVFSAKGQVSFKRARIEKPELFSFDTLLLRPNWFVGVDARKFDFTAVQWYGLSNGSADAFDKEIKGIREKGETGSPYILLAQACRRLSANAEENREYPLANEFHYWSMDALRRESWDYLIWIRKWLNKSGLRVARRCGLATTVSLVWSRIRRRRQSRPRGRFGLINALYWALSGYGVRAARAFWMLVAIWAAFTTLYVLGDPPEFKDFGQGIGYLWQAAVYSLLALARLDPEPRPEEPGVFQFLVGLEGILGPLQIALLALAIRRKVMR